MTIGCEATLTSTYLSVDGLRVRYGRVRILHDLSLEVARGELIALLGASGCGKTTLLRSISGLVPVEQGTILVSGQDIARLPPERRGTAMVFQSYALWPHMSVAQNIGYGLKVRGWSRARIAARVDEMLELLQLPGLAQRNVVDLSGGQRQRVALGRALAIEPSLLLLDEPLSNLDARIRQELRHEIRALQQRLGITALHVTHDREEAMVMADRIVVLDQGRIAQIGTPEELFERPASPFVAAFMGADNVVEVEGETLGDRVAIRAGTDHAAASLPLGPQGVHLVGGAGGPLHAHFRGAAARLVPAGAPGPLALTLRGRVTQRAYLGAGWRYGVEVGRGHYLVDDAQRLEVGDAVGVAVPPEALYLFRASASTPATAQ
jgi:ABC-type Fe3+/spermidine/putrescine transport system ATPase subunit